MLSVRLLRLVVVVLFSSGTQGANDWSKPCFNGECAYDLPQSSGSSGIFKLSGDPKGITDITPAAGWIILDCDPNSLEQDIRLVCEVDHVGWGCQNLFDRSGPVNKVVRLPESCGNGPFARIADMRVADDQSVSPHTARKLRRRDGTTPQVHVMKIDANWAKLDRTKSGDIKFLFVGVNSPGVDLNSAVVDWDPFSDLANWVDDTVSKAAEKVQRGVQWLGDQWDNVKIAAQDLAKFQIQPKVESTLIDITGHRSLAKTINLGQCGADLGIKLDVTTSGSVTVKAGAIIAGSFLGAQIIQEIALFGGINGEADAILQVGLQISGGFDTGEKKLMSDMGLPGLSINGVFTIGPYLSVAARVQGELEIDISAEVHLSYTFSDVEVWFPKDMQSHALTKGIANRDSDLSFSASGKVQAQGVIQGTLIPSINFGIAVAGGKVADVAATLGVEIWTRASAEVTAEVTGSINAVSKKMHTAKVATKKKKPNTTSKPKAKSKSKSKSKKVRRPATRSPRELSVDDVSAGVSACFWLQAGIRLVASAKGSILSWDANTDKYTLLSTKPPWEIFSRCWSAGQAADASTKPTWAKELLAKSSSKSATCSAGGALPSSVSDQVKGKTLVA